MKPSPAEARAPRRIFVVGGDEPLRHALDDAVARLGRGWQLEFHDSPEQSLRPTKLNPPAVMLLAGSAVRLGTTSQSRAAFSLMNQAPVIVLAESADPVQVIECLMAGAVGYLVLPVTGRELALAAGRAAVREPALCAAAEAGILEWLRAMATHPQIEPLSRRENQVMLLWMRGLGVKEMSALLGVAESTINSHKASLRLRLGVHTRKDLLLKVAVWHRKQL